MVFESAKLTFNLLTV